jgi:hypothetical protein
MHGEDMKIRKSVAVDPEVWDGAQALGRRLERSTSWAFNTAMREYLARINTPSKERKTRRAPKQLEAAVDLSA